MRARGWWSVASFFLLCGLFMVGAVFANPLPSPGPCCFAGGACQVLPPDLCSQAGGYWLGVDVSCDPNPCFGACCTELGTCVVEDYVGCVMTLGGFMGSGTTCDVDPCHLGACCLANGSCILVHRSECLAQNGTFMIEQYGCEPHPCDHLGACCRFDYTCFVTVEALCGYNWRGESTDCDPSPCFSGGLNPSEQRSTLSATPNPFTEGTTLRLPDRGAGVARCWILDVRGRIVRDLTSTGATGASSLRWDGLDDAGRAVPAGAYFVRVQTNAGESNLLLLRLR